MQNTKKIRVLEFHHDTVDYLRGLFGLDKPEEMEKMLDLFEEWMKMQQHFIKKDYSRSYLEGILLISSKGSLERAKRSLDKRCTYKTIMPQYFGNFDIRNDFKELEGKLNFCMIPKLNENHERIYVARLRDKNPAPTFGVQSLRIIIMIIEYLHWYPDRTNGYIMVIDLIETSVQGFLKVFNITEMQHVETVLMKGYASRVKGIHFLSQSKLVEILLKLLKEINEKLSKRVHIHQSKESLAEFLPKELLPRDYGGTQKDLKELHEDWIEALSDEDFREYLSDVSAGGTDESLRDTASFNEQYMGTPGTFRALSLD